MLGHRRFMSFRRLFQRLPFLIPLSLISILGVVVYFCLSLSADRNFTASGIRDDEELRQARAATKLNEWKQRSNFLPFHYDSSTKGSIPYARLAFPPGITFSMLLPNRAEYLIDAYESSYAVESFASLISAIEHDLSTYGSRYNYINITLCPTTDRLDSFTELLTLQSSLPKHAVKPRSVSMNRFSLTCRTVLDAANCLYQSATALSNRSFLLLFEDDMIINDDALNRLWHIFSHFDVDTSTTTLVPGLVQLHVPYTSLRYALTDRQSLLELLLLSSILMFFLTAVCLRNWFRPLMFEYNGSFLACSMLVCMLIVCLFGRARWLLWWHKLTAHQSVSLSTHPHAPATGAAMLIPVKLARGVAEFLNTFTCDELDLRESVSKSELISHYLSTHNFHIWRTFPNLFRHRGLYSVYLKDILDPNFVE